MAGQTKVAESNENPSQAFEVNTLPLIRLLEYLTALPADETKPRHPKILFASTCEIFGDPQEAPQTEATPIAPTNPYGISKAAATQMARHYRDNHGVWISNAILYNHESPRRPATFVTRKITKGVAAIAQGQATELRLANLDSQRDWGHAKDYAEAFWRMLQQEAPTDYVIATGRRQSVQDFVQEAFKAAGIEDWQRYGKVDEQLAKTRPSDQRVLVGDASKAKRELGWKPTTSFQDLVQEMVAEDMKRPETP